MNPITTVRNKYHSNIKNSSIYTPFQICDFLFDLLHPIFNRKKSGKFIIDPSIGSGNLIKSFSEHDYKIIGYDINNDRKRINKRQNWLSNVGSLFL